MMKRPLFDVGFSVLLTTAAVLYFGKKALLLLPICILAALICSGRSKDRRFRRAAIVLLAGAVGILYLLLRLQLVRTACVPLDGTRAVVIATVTEQRDKNMYECFGTVTGEAGTVERVRLTLWCTTADELQAGESFRCAAEVTFNDPLTSEYRSSAGESRYLYCFADGEIERLSEPLYPLKGGVASLRAAVSRGFTRQFGQETGSLLSALVTGLRPGEADYVEQSRDAGVYHVLAISGMHIAIFCDIISALLFLLPLRPRIRSALLLVALWGPVLLSGGNQAVLRSAIMYSVTAFGRAIGRKADSLNSLGFAVLLLLLADPFAALSYGFLLSVLATLGLLLYTPGLARYLEDKPLFRITGKAGAAAVSSLSCGVAAQVVILPLLYAMDGRIVLNGLLAGLVILPLMTPLLFFGYLLVPVVLFGAGSTVAAVLGFPAGLLARLFLRLTAFFAEFPFVFYLNTPAQRLLLYLLEGLLLLLTVIGCSRRLAAMAIPLAVSLTTLVLLTESFLLDGTARVITRGEDTLLLSGDRAVLLLAGREGGMLEELRRYRVQNVDLLILEDYDSLLAPDTAGIFAEYPPVRVAGPDSGAVTSYLDAVYNGELLTEDTLTIQLYGDLALDYRRGDRLQVRAGDILLLKFFDIYAIIGETVPDAVLLPDGTASLGPAPDGLSLWETGPERSELVLDVGRTH